MAERLTWFLFLLAFWCLLSGKWDLFHFGSGVLSCLAAAWFAGGRGPAASPESRRALPGRVFRFLRYLVWLAQHIIMAAWHVAAVVLHPKLRLNPKISTHASLLSGEKSLAIFGTSITLTPGTITVDIQGRDVTVHELDADSAGDITSGAMEKEIARIAAPEGGRA